MSLQLPATRRVLLSPGPFQAGTYPWVQREPHSMACGNTAFRCARHKQREEDCLGPKGALLCPTGFSPGQASRCVCLLAWAAGAGSSEGWAGMPELPLWSGRQGKSRSGSSAASLPHLTKGVGSTSTIQAPNMLAGVVPIG